MQEHELSLLRHYEAQLLEREDSALDDALVASSSTSNALTQMSQLMRQALRAMQGEDYEERPSGEEYEEFLSAFSVRNVNREMSPLPPSSPPSSKHSLPIATSPGAASDEHRIVSEGETA